MTIYDISLPISESLIVWPGDPGIGITLTSHVDRGDMATVSRLDLGAHIGTHVDAPAHFFSGAAGVDTLDLDLLVGPALVFHALEADALSARVLADLGIPYSGMDRVWHGYEFDAACTGEHGEIYLGESDRVSHLFLYFPPIRRRRLSQVRE